MLKTFSHICRGTPPNFLKYLSKFWSIINGEKLKIGFFWFLLKRIKKSVPYLFWGAIIFAISLTIAGCSEYLTFSVYNTSENSSLIPWYLGIIALLLSLLALILVVQGVVNLKKPPALLLIPRALIEKASFAR